jgi:hypothetical protein
MDDKIDNQSNDTGGNDKLISVYNELCTSRIAIDDFRTKLLGFLPLITGGGIFFLFKDEGELESFKPYLGAIGFFGFVITLGLFFYELHGIKKCDHLIKIGRHIETKLGIEGQYKSRPNDVLGIINEPFTACVIYSVVLGAWAYIGFIQLLGENAWIIGLAGFIFFFITSFYLLRKGKFAFEWPSEDANLTGSPPTGKFFNRGW